jgi:homoprotocatechuate degradation regulator HpaR
MDADRKDTSAGRGEPTRLNLPLLLLQSRERLIGRFRPALKRHGVTDQQYRVLRAIETHASLEPREICAICHISSPSLTGVLARMERDGLVRRERDPADQRRTVIEATAKGRKMVERLSHSVEAHYQWLEKSLGKQKLAQLYGLLDELIELEQP